MDEYNRTPRATRSTGGRGGNNQRGLIVMAAIAVVFLIIGGIIGKSCQSSALSDAIKKRDAAQAEKDQLKSEYETQIATYEALVADQADEIARLNSSTPTSTGGDSQNETPSTPDGSDSEKKSGGNWLLTFIIIFVIVILVISAIYISYNAFKKKDSDEDDDDDYDDDDYDDDDDDYVYDDDYDDEDEYDEYDLDDDED